MTIIQPHRSEGARLLKEARRLAPLLNAHGEQHDREGRLAPEVIDALVQAGFIRMYAPRELGGAEVWPVDSLTIVEELAAADLSTGWVTFVIGLGTGVTAAFLPEASVQTVFADGAMPWVCGNGLPNGIAIAVDGGYRVSGDWSYGSGVKHAQWIHSGVIVHEDGKPRLDEEGNPLFLVVITPREQMEFGDNWHVMGLRGTGSIDYKVRDLFVPADFAHSPLSIEPNRGGDVYHLGLLGLGVTGHTAVALGAARRMLDEIAAVAREKTGPTGKLGDSDRFREGFGVASAHYLSARAFAHETWREIEARVVAKGGYLTTRDYTHIRLALNNANWSALHVARFAFEAGGGSALRTSVLQRYFRDIHAATQHGSSAPSVTQECGRELAGLADGKKWLGNTLVNAAPLSAGAENATERDLVGRSSVTYPSDVYPESGCRLPLPKRDDLEPKAQAAFDQYVTMSTSVPLAAGLKGPAGILMHSPDFAEREHNLNRYLRLEAGLTPRERELCILVAAREMDQQFEWAAHEQISIDEGLDDALIDVVRTRDSTDGLAAADATIITLGREAIGAKAVSPATFARAHALFGARKLVDIAGLMGNYVAGAVLLNVFDVQLPPGTASTLPAP